MFGDKNIVGDIAMTPRGKMHKTHKSLYSHRMRESIAVKILNWMFIDGKNNPDDVITKCWAHHEIWSTLKPFLFWPGENYVVC